MENKTYYGEYDFKILVETSINKTPVYNRNNFKHKIASKSSMSPFINKTTKEFMKDSLYINESDFPNICSYADRQSTASYIKKYFSNGNFYYKIIFLVPNDGKPDTFFMFYIDNERFYPTITTALSDLRCEITIDKTSPIYNKIGTIIKNMNILVYRIDPTVPLDASFLGYNSDTFTKKNDFLSMESFEGKLTIAEENQYTNHKYYDIIYQNYNK